MATPFRKMLESSLFDLIGFAYLLWSEQVFAVK